MARKKKIKEIVIPAEIPFSIPDYYVYYNNKTGQLLSITNEADNTYENKITVSHETIAGFFTGDQLWNDYIVAQVEESDGSHSTQLIPKYAPKYDFKNNEIIHIRKNNIETADLKVACDYNNSCWIFSISKDAKLNFDKNYDKTFLFFVTLENDFNFLVRTIEIRSKDLFLNDIKINFENTYEYKTNCVSISTVNLFRSYNLTVYE